MTKPRKGQAPPKLSRHEFKARFDQHFADPAFEAAREAITRVEAIAWHAYDGSRKAPLTRKAGAEFADPDYDLSVEWLETRDRLRRAEAAQKDPATRSRVWDWSMPSRGRSPTPWVNFAPDACRCPTRRW